MKHFINLIVFGLLLVASVATSTEIAGNCLKHADHNAVTVLLVDRTDFMKDKRRFSQKTEVGRDAPTEHPLGLAIQPAHPR